MNNLKTYLINSRRKTDSIWIAFLRLTAKKSKIYSADIISLWHRFSEAFSHIKIDLARIF